MIMGKLKINKDNLKINPQEKKYNNIVFDLSSITENKTYSFGYFKNDNIREQNEAYREFHKKIMELGKKSYIDMIYESKNTSFEKIPYKEFKEGFKGSLDASGIVSKDSSLLVFRFCKQKYRIICKDDINQSNVLHIIGFDFNYSAYNH